MVHSASQDSPWSSEQSVNTRAGQVAGISEQPEHLLLSLLCQAVPNLCSSQLFEPWLMMTSGHQNHPIWLWAPCDAQNSVPLQSTSQSVLRALGHGIKVPSHYGSTPPSPTCQCRWWHCRIPSTIFSWREGNKERKKNNKKNTTKKPQPAKD